MSTVEHGLIAGSDQVAAVVGALAASTCRLLLGASRPGRAVGALVTVRQDRFVLASSLLEPAAVSPALAIARGELADLPSEACTIVDEIVDYLAVPPTPVAPGRSTPLPVEDALMLAEQLRRGDPTHLDEALDLSGLGRAPDWLMDLAPGAQASLTAAFVDERGIELLADLTATPHGWGELLCTDDEILTFDPMTEDDVRARLGQACDLLVTRTLDADRAA